MYSAGNICALVQNDFYSEQLTNTRFILSVELQIACVDVDIFRSGLTQHVFLISRLPFFTTYMMFGKNGVIAVSIVDVGA